MMKRFILEFFTWWNRETLGTRLWTWWRGEFVGEDEFANRYYRERNGPRRWVIYNGLVEASAIPPGWHGWIHHRVDAPPGPYQKREWEKPYLPNLTGTPGAYRPKGSILGIGKRPKSDGEYDAWTP